MNATSSTTRLTIVIGITLLISLLLAIQVPTLQAQTEPPELRLEKTIFGDLTVVETGVPFEYILSYTCASINFHCEGATITDTLPSEVEFVSLITTPDIDTATYDAINHEVTFVFKEPLPAGNTGILRIAAQFPVGSTPGQTATNDAEFGANNAVDIVSAPIDISSEGTFEMFAQKTLLSEPVEGFPIEFELAVCSPDSTGGVRFENVMFTDLLPAAATFVTAEGVEGVDWEYSPGTDTVTYFDIGTAEVGECLTRVVTVMYDEIPVNAAQTNTLDVTGTPQGCSDAGNLATHCNGVAGPITLDPVTAGFTVIEPYGGGGVIKSSTSASTFDGVAPSGSTEILPGEGIVYTVSANNSGFLTHTNASLLDTLPSEAIVESLTITPTQSGGVDGFYEVDNSGTFVPFPNNPYLTQTTETTATLGITNSQQITRIRWDLGQLLAGESWSADITAGTSSTLPVGITFDNCMDYSADADDGAIAENACNTVSVIDERSIPRARKSADPGPYLPGQQVVFTSRVTNDGVAQQPYNDPILADLLPEVFSYISGTASFISGPIGAPTPIFTATEDYNGSGRTLLRWSWEGSSSYSVQPGEELVVEFIVQIADDAAPGRYQNHSTIFSNSVNPNPFLCDGTSAEYTDVFDIDGDNDFVETTCQNTDGEGFADVSVFLAMSSKKFVQGAYDNEFSDMGLTFPGGELEYKMVLTNTSNITVSNVVVYDILPFIGDTGVIDPSTRETEWRPNLQGAIVPPAGIPVTIYYSESQNPCRPELVSSGPAGCEDDWSTELPADVVNVQAVKFEFCDEVSGCYEVARNESFEFIWPMVAPNDAPTHPSCLTEPFNFNDHPDCQIAWNSFGFTAEGGGLTLRPAEPLRVGIRVADQPNLTFTLGDYVWLDIAGQEFDGIQQPEEMGVDGVRVELYYDDGTPVDLDNNGEVDYRITGPDHNGLPGYYQFGGLPADDYVLRFYPPAGYTPSPSNIGDDNTDSDPHIAGTDPTYGSYLETDIINLTADDNSWDFGLWLPVDYGDAPAGYPVEAATQTNPADAARHVIVPGFFMGAGVDDELDGQPSYDGFGDDTGSAGDDEDGVTFPEYIGTAELPTVILQQGENSTWQIDVTVPPTTTGYLNAWVDWNGDGVWATDGSESIAVDLAAAEGTSTLSVPISVPIVAQHGVTYARFRFSSEQGLLPTGTAFDGEVEDYALQIMEEPVKALVATSEAHTSGSNVAIGEIVRYTLTVNIPEGAATNFTITDTLPTDLRYLDDGSVTVSHIADTPVTSGTLVVAGAPFNDGVDPVFQLGTVTNGDQDTDLEYLIIEFNALVVNSAETDAADTLNNTFDVSYNNFTRTSNQVTVTIVEPLLTIAKTVIEQPSDAGDQVVYQIVVTNDAGAATAFDGVISDTLNSYLTLVDHSVVAPGGTAMSDSSADPLVQYGFDQLAAGDSITLLITATVNANVPTGNTIPNVANVTYTSLPDAGTVSNPTGSTTPGGTGAENGERNGEGTDPNDHVVSDSATIMVTEPQFDKLTPADTIYTIGETVTFDLLITLPEGTTQAVVVEDNLPVGLNYVSHLIITTTAAVDSPLSADFGGTLPTPTVTAPGGSGADVSWNFGDVTTTANNDGADNSFAVRITARVLNEIGNQNGDTPTNIGSLTYTNAAGSPVTITDNESISLVEPVLSLDKTLVDRPFPIAVGTTITYQVVLQHDGLSTADAFDVVVTDTLPARFDPATLTLASIDATGVAVPSVELDTTNGIVRVPNSADSLDLPQSAIVTLTFTADLDATYIPGPPIVNTVGVVWSSTDGENPDERDGGSPTPNGQDFYSETPTALDDYEVEDSAVFNSADFGDLPDTGSGSYETLNANGGAFHFIDGVTYFGASVDGENDGQPTTNADGDGADEDGITFLTPLMPGTTAQVEVVVAGGGYVNGWIDFDGNGTLDAGERIIADSNLAAGTHVINFPVPDIAIADEIYSRFRITNEAGAATSPDGEAPSGEVEDYVLMSLGNTVWYDNGGTSGVANDGILNGDEALFENVILELHDENGQPITDANSNPITTTTAADGTYLFTGLAPDDYIVHVSAENFTPTGVLYGLASSAGAGLPNGNLDQDTDENGVDSADPVTNGVSSAAITLDLGNEPSGTNGHSNLTLDFSFVDIDWGDLPAGYPTTLTDDGARHIIDNVTFLGSSVDEEADGQPSVIATGDDAADSPDDEDGITFLTPVNAGQTAEIQVVAGADGFLNAWIDFDGNGTFSEREQISTDEPLTAGTHTITVNVPAGAEMGETLYSRFRFTSYDTLGTLEATGLANDGEVEDYALLSLGDRVWLDADADGVQDGGEMGIGGVVVNLLDENGQPILDANNNPITTTTDKNGNYHFGGLPENNYIVEVAPSNWQAGNVFGTGGAYEAAFGSPNQGGDDTTLDDDNGNNDGAAAIGNGVRSTVINLALNDENAADGSDVNTNNTVDFGFYTPVAIGNVLWNDNGAGAGRSNNGILDGDEAGIEGVAVELYLDDDGTPGFSAGDTFVISTTTSITGTYLFDTLIPADYVVHIPASEFGAGQPLEHYVSSTSAGGDVASDQDADENGIDSADLATDGLSSSTIALAAFTEPESEASQSTYNGVLPDSSVNMTVDFAVYQPVAIGNVIWLDNGAGAGEPNDGILSGDEVGIADVDVVLYRDTDGSGDYTLGIDQQVAMTTTVAGGSYLFDNLPPDAYIVHIPAAEFTSGELQGLTSSRGAGGDVASDQDVDENGIDTATLTTVGLSSGVIDLQAGSEPQSELTQPAYTGTLPDENVNMTVDFGLVDAVAIGNIIWADNGAGAGEPNNGMLDGSEGGIANVEVQLFLDTDGIAGFSVGDTFIISQTTGSDGSYLFDNMPPGDYIVYIPPSEFAADAPLHDFVSSTGNGGDIASDQITDENGIDSSDPATTGIASTVIQLEAGSEPESEASQSAYTGTLPDNAVNMTVDFAFYEPVAIGNTVWDDDGAGVGVANNGILDGDEVGINNVKVELYIDSDGSGDFDIAFDTFYTDTLTSGNGQYLFDNLPPNQYIVHIPASEFAPAAPLADFVSSTGNGGDIASDQETDENGVDAATPATTGVSSVAIDLQANVEPQSESTQGDYTGVLPDENVNMTVDFGFYEPVALGNTIWLDNGNGGANNGMLDAGEAGLEGVVVELFLDDGDGVYTVSVDTFVISTTTNVSGTYLFDNLTPGAYVVHIPASEFGAGEPLAGLYSSTNHGGDIVSDQDVDENGVDAADPATTGVSSVAIDLQAADEPENELSQSDYSGVLPDDSVNMTVDFAFVGYDYGDLPESGTSYPTTTANGGANHLIVDGVYLGAAVDAEQDGQPNAGATGDDDAATDDEDGVEFSAPLTPGATVVVTVTASADGFLNTWFDWNGDGTLDAGERYFNDTPLVAGANALSVTVPNDADPAALFSRFRYTLDAGQVTAPTGNATSGEVEDYVLMSIGNTVWLDDGGTTGTADNSIFDGDEQPIDEVIVELYSADQNPATDTPILTTTTSITGTYQFTGLPAGDYVVHIPASEFGGGEPLENLFSPPGSGNPNSPLDQDADENGMDNAVPSVNGISSGTINVTAGGLPTNEDGDANSNLNVDFGFTPTLNVPADWGDLPSSYPTADANGGAHHVIDGATYLGAGVDAEMDGQPNAAANGDDGDGNDDEDGVVFGGPLMPGATVNVTVTASTAGYLNAWFDWNGDGFDGGEQLFTDELLTAGENVLSVTVPLSADASSLYSRFRFTSDQNQATTPSGRATNGEVEDYVLMSLGNTIWLDNGGTTGTSNNGILDGDEAPVQGVVVTLQDGNGNPVLDANNNPITTTTAVDGTYKFVGLPAGDYIVHIPAGQFTGGEPLDGMISSNGAGDPNADLDQSADENGIDDPTPDVNGISTAVITLEPGTAPTSEDGDANSNLTVDFGFYKPLAIGNLVWHDNGADANTNNGIFDGDELGINDVTVQLYIDADQDGLFDITKDRLVTETTTMGGGNYLFTGLAPDDYFVHISAAEFGTGGDLYDTGESIPYQSSSDMDGLGGDTGVDQNGDENGVDPVAIATDGVTSNLIALGTGDEPLNEVDSSPAGYADGDANLTVDFSFYVPSQTVVQLSGVHVDSTQVTLPTLLAAVLLVTLTVVLRRRWLA